MATTAVFLLGAVAGVFGAPLYKDLKFLVHKTLGGTEARAFIPLRSGPNGRLEADVYGKESGGNPEVVQVGLNFYHPTGWHGGIDAGTDGLGIRGGYRVDFVDTRGGRLTGLVEGAGKIGGKHSYKAGLHYQHDSGLYGNIDIDNAYGAVIDGGYNGPIFQSPNGQMTGYIDGSKRIGEDPVYKAGMEYRHNSGLHVGVDKGSDTGTVIHGGYNAPQFAIGNGKVVGNIHGSKTLGGVETVGGGLIYEHKSGLRGGIDVSHTGGLGNTYSANIGRNIRLGKGSLTLTGGITNTIGSDVFQGQFGINYIT